MDHIWISASLLFGWADDFLHRQPHSTHGCSIGSWRVNHLLPPRSASTTHQCSKHQRIWANCILFLHLSFHQSSQSIICQPVYPSNHLSLHCHFFWSLHQDFNQSFCCLLLIYPRDSTGFSLELAILESAAKPNDHCVVIWDFVVSVRAGQLYCRVLTIVSYWQITVCTIFFLISSVSFASTFPPDTHTCNQVI